MKKIFLALMACAALAGCKDEQGGAFVGVWKNDGKLVETITVTKAAAGYRAKSVLGNGDGGFMDVEITLTSEGDNLLVKGDKQKGLELAADGTMKSYLRREEKTFNKVQ